MEVSTLLAYHLAVPSGWPAKMKQGRKVNLPVYKVYGMDASLTIADRPLQIFAEAEPPVKTPLDLKQSAYNLAGPCI